MEAASNTLSQPRHAGGGSGHWSQAPFLLRGHVRLPAVHLRLFPPNHPQEEYRLKAGAGDEDVATRLVVTSGKMVLLDKLLRRLQDTGHRCAHWGWGGAGRVLLDVTV